MKYKIDINYLLKTMGKIMSVPSPVGYYVKMKPVIEEIASELGCSVTYSNGNTAYITMEGEDNSKTVMLGSHLDTLGMVVRSIDSNGMLSIKKLGGGCIPSMEGEYVTIHTRDGREYSGLIICKSHSVHVFDDANTLQRTEDTLKILLDEPVSNKNDVKELGIQNGDYVSIDPRFTVTKNGYVKSRFIDDKGGVACCLASIKYMRDNNCIPKHKTIFAFPFYEEIGLGGSFVPEGVSEFLCVDIGLIGPEHDGNERSVSICAKDAGSPYDYELTSRLINLAKKTECSYAVDVFYHYSSDATAALRAGNNLKIGAFGMAVYCSHGVERTHIDGLEATSNLLLAYLLD
jgi:putative aminopeptidase FrvX